MCKNPLICTAGGRFHFITVQGRHLFKKTTFTVSTLPRARLQPPRTGRASAGGATGRRARSEEHTSELQSRGHLVCRLMHEKKQQTKSNIKSRSAEVTQHE